MLCKCWEIAALEVVIVIAAYSYLISNEPEGYHKGNICSLPPVVGSCRASLFRWYHNATNHSCEQFIYGGCDGNENNFENKTSCEDTCIHTTAEEGDKNQVPLRQVDKKAKDSLPSRSKRSPKDAKPPQATPQGNDTSRNSSGKSKEGSTPQKKNVPLNGTKDGTPASSSLTTVTSKVEDEKKSIDRTILPSSTTTVIAENKNKETIFNLPFLTTTEAFRPSPSLTITSDNKNSETILPSSTTITFENRDKTTLLPSFTITEAIKRKDDKTTPLLSLTTVISEKEDETMLRSLITTEALKMTTTSLTLTTVNSTNEGNETPLPSREKEGPHQEVESEDNKAPLPGEKNPHLGGDNTASTERERNDQQTSHFASFFLASIVAVFVVYGVYHNRQKIVAIVIEGRSMNDRGRRGGYNKLETTVEEAMPSMKSTNTAYVY